MQKVDKKHDMRPMSIYLFIIINTNEIPGELSRENMIIFTHENNMLFSHVKISLLLWLNNKSRLSQDKTVSVKWFGISLLFI